MKFVSMKQMLMNAKNESYAVGQYNLNTLLWAIPILKSAESEQSPVIIGASDRLIENLGGFKTIVSTVKELMEELSITVPIALHLDHGMSVERCKQAIDAGFSSVMIDGSNYPIEKNISLTKEVTGYAKQFGVSVEAEVGSVGGTEDGMVGAVDYADVGECIRLVEETGVDALAAALGSVHGRYKGELKFGFKEMEEISKQTNVPLVLHGGSGIPVNQIKKAIKLGHAKINVNMESANAWTNSIREYLKDEQNDEVYEPQLFLSTAYEAIEKIVKSKIQDFGTSKKYEIL